MRKVKCLYCDREMVIGRLPRHIQVSHKPMTKMEFYKLYYWDGVEDLNCKYCGSERKAIRNSRLYDTCGSKACKSSSSSEGIRTQQKDGLGVHTSEGRAKAVATRLKSDPEAFSRIGKLGIQAVNRIRRETGFRSRFELQLYGILELEFGGGSVSCDDSRYHHSRGNSEPCGGNFIIDFIIESANLAIELDGSSHGGMMGKSRASIKAQDQKKEDFLVSRGWKFLRLQNEELGSTEQVLEKIRRAV